VTTKPLGEAFEHTSTLTYAMVVLSMSVMRSQQ